MNALKFVLNLNLSIWVVIFVAFAFMVPCYPTIILAIGAVLGAINHAFGD